MQREMNGVVMVRRPAYVYMDDVKRGASEISHNGNELRSLARPRSALPRLAVSLSNRMAGVGDPVTSKYHRP